MPRGNFFEGFTDSLIHVGSDWSRGTSWLEFGFPAFVLSLRTGGRGRYGWRNGERVCWLSACYRSCWFPITRVSGAA